MSPRTGSNLVRLVGERCGERGGVVHSMGQHGASWPHVSKGTRWVCVVDHLRESCSSSKLVAAADRRPAEQQHVLTELGVRAHGDPPPGQTDNPPQGADTEASPQMQSAAFAWAAP